MKDVDYESFSKEDLIQLAKHQKQELIKLEAIKNQYANQYFKIWFGSAPFSDTLKRQLLNP